MYRRDPQCPPLRHSNTPSLRVAEFEDEDEAPGEMRAICLHAGAGSQTPRAY
jgi:hypothetical protein